MDMLEKIDLLNKKIDALMRERNRIEAQKDVYEEKLNSSIAKYREDYGTNLVGSDFSSTKENITNAFLEVSEKVNKEYELAQKVVSAIDSGDIDLANSLVGVGTTPVRSPINRVGNTVNNPVTTDTGIRENTEMGTVGYPNRGIQKVERGVELEDLKGENLISRVVKATPEPVKTTKSVNMKMKKSSSFGVKSVGDTFNSMSFASNDGNKESTKGSHKGVVLGGFSFDDDDIDEDEPNYISDDYDYTDNTDDFIEDDNFGFSEMLKGSKLKL